jgi:hypothetical protein
MLYILTKKLYILQNFYKDNRLNKGEYARKMDIETRNIISKNTTSSKH